MSSRVASTRSRWERARVKVLPLALVTALSSCAPHKTLEGSVTERLDLSFERVEALASKTEVSVSFLRPQGAGQDTILKVAARLEGVSLEPRTAIDLAQRVGGAEGPQRGAVSRSVLEEPVRAFPEIARGELVFDGYLDSGKTVTGELHITFVNGTDVYSGRTIFGRFEATVP
ncbi:hypothetical protein [Vitiosangium sp. GDMCC 1.1324]|uniref:hypothetical protein n=1 Tax=Vitiosangium sp. (strain GDMCC 1.1324) TaxID=2138576 RepID=UPI000D3C0448|nr:hypothetical protein [Vitiosangium sp. GDMCC 1.1324]PTL81947.1 hypothetical protein DAT35_19205 [Vitiosangium sp. GDMCC 1.1324]